MRPLLVLAALSLLASACSEASAAEPAAGSLVPIVVTARDLPIGTILTDNDLAQLSIPASLVTSSMIKPESASFIVKQRLTFPMLVGDPMLWSFVDPLYEESREDCAKFGSEDTSAQQQVARARQIVLLHGH